MSLMDQFSVNANYTRSINLERDSDSLSVTKSYIPTNRAKETLKTVGNTISDIRPMPRAWTLMGPYGSGKSSFAVYLSHLLGSYNEEATKVAFEVLQQADEDLADLFWDDNENPLEHCRVLLTGSPDKLSKRLVGALLTSTSDYFKHRAILPSPVQQLEMLNEQKEVTTTEIVTVITDLQSEISKVGGYGLLIVIDELGKFLEYEARHADANDIFLLQALAEHAYKGSDDQNGALLSIFVMLHQSFDQYARGLSKTQRNEWAKVQGRFEVIPFLESAEQTLRIVGKALESSVELPASLLDEISGITNHLVSTNALPSSLTEESANELFQQCYPLHPISALILPVLCQRVAQNERTLFNYMGSQEPFGFQSSLSTLEKIGDWIYPSEIFDYFISNQPAAVVDHVTHRRWAEVVTALERLGNADSDSVKMLKIVGLMNIVGSQGGLKASKAILQTCFPKKGQANKAIVKLEKAALLQFRKFNMEYRVWQGSDFDIQEKLQEAHEKQGVFDLASWLNEKYAGTPVVARKFSIQKGAMQYFTIHFANVARFNTLVTDGLTPRIIFFIAEDSADEKLFETECLKAASSMDILVRYSNTAGLRESVAEVIALDYIQATSQELHSDPVAQREFKDYQTLANKANEAQIKLVLDHPELSSWYWKEAPLAVANRRSLQSSLSYVLQSVFSSMPTIKNELINRDKPSSQAAAGRNKLLEAMLNSGSEADLGIDKYPPEKTIYRAVLRETGLHVDNEDGSWSFARPSKDSSLHPVWSRIDEFYAETENRALTFAELEKVLTRAPFGVKKGVLPILYLASYLVNESELALYEEGRYLPSISKDALERFVKTPSLFQVQRFRIEGVRSSIFKQYVRALFRDENERTVIQAIKPLASFVADLNEFTQKTTDGISPQTRRFRSAFSTAKSPERLLFEDIPRALGVRLDSFEENDEGTYIEAIQECIRQLKNAYSKMLAGQQGLLAQALQLEPNSTLDEIRNRTGRYQDLQRLTVDTDGLKAFINRLVEDKKSNDEWFVDVLMFLARKHPEKWLDSDKTLVDSRLSDYSRRLLELETIRIQQDRIKHSTDDSFEVTLLKSVKQGSKEHMHPVVIRATQRAAAETLKDKLQECLDSCDDKDLQLAALAELVDGVLGDYLTTSETKNLKKAQKKKAMK